MTQARHFTVDPGESERKDRTAMMLMSVTLYNRLVEHHPHSVRYLQSRPGAQKRIATPSCTD